jgi:HEPN domain-containing protein
MTAHNEDEWVVRARHDFDTAQLLVRSKSESHEIICFHCQQCIEKLLKAILVKNKVDFPRIHDLVKLANVTSGIIPSISGYYEMLAELNEYAVAGRYPGEIVDASDAKEAFHISSTLREVLLDGLIQS